MRDKIDLKWKIELEGRLYKAAPAIHKDLRVNVMILGRRYELSARCFKQLSNEVANLVILQKQLQDKNYIDKVRVGAKFPSLSK